MGNHPQAAATQGNLWSTWLSGLPCQEDTEEGSRNNKALLRLAQQQTPGLVGDGGRNIPRVIDLLVNAYSTDFVDVETSKAIPLFCSHWAKPSCNSFPQVLPRS